jgi:hypothetical protein
VRVRRGRGRRRRRRSQPIDLVDSGAELRYWKDASGNAFGFEGLAASVDEIRFTFPTIPTSPFESHYEGYMGNYGDTLIRWYHGLSIRRPRTSSSRVSG